jgi:hypothetical protein
MQKQARGRKENEKDKSLLAQRKRSDGFHAADARANERKGNPNSQPSHGFTFSPAAFAKLA